MTCFVSNHSFLSIPSVGLAPAPTFAVDVRTALTSGASYLNLVRQALASAQSDQTTLARLGESAPQIGAVVACLDKVSAELADQMLACGSLVDAALRSATMLEEYRNRGDYESTPEG